MSENKIKKALARWWPFQKEQAAEAPEQPEVELGALDFLKRSDRHLAGAVQQMWLAGYAKFPRLRSRSCPHCGANMGRSQKRACSIECYKALRDHDFIIGQGGQS